VGSVAGWEVGLGPHALLQALELACIEPLARGTLRGVGALYKGVGCAEGRGQALALLGKLCLAGSEVGVLGGELAALGWGSGGGCGRAVAGHRCAGRRYLCV
jgi:hypothetical protein